MRRPDRVASVLDVIRNPIAVSDSEVLTELRLSIQVFTEKTVESSASNVSKNHLRDPLISYSIYAWKLEPD